MTEVFKFLVDSFYNFLSVFADKTTFSFFGVNINFLQILVAFIVLGLITSAFWKGERT